MDNRPLGVFDSGLGGLTAVRAIQEKLPGEDIVYLGDTLRCPYGDKSDETILQYVTDDVDFLISQNVKAIIIACNTADSHSLAQMREKCDIPVLGVIDNAAAMAAKITKNHKIGMIATAATVRSGRYTAAIHKIDSAIEVFELATPLLVPIIEAGHTDIFCNDLRETLENYLKILAENEIDTLILGCTHYPLIREAVTEILPNVNIVCSGEATITELNSLLCEKDMYNFKVFGGKTTFYTTGDPENFRINAEKILDCEAVVRKSLNA